uniref:Uncharacterized protein LOC105051233 n=1 Tax=Elaeis guineensis var. tenera TaxID=51953 RepID=A0A6I9RPM7_ELAGV|nr:uncharacterized protein LOC105051233 [Elaeis guineensis]
MDIILCDELLQEIFQRLPPSSAPSVSLVSKRWLVLLRSSTTSLSIRIPSSPTNSCTSSTATPSLSSILSHYPFLSNLTIRCGTFVTDDHLPSHPSESLSSSDTLLLTVAASDCSHRLYHLRFFPDSTVSPSALVFSASSFTRLTSLQLTSLLPLSFRWLVSFPSLRSFSLVQTRHKQPYYHPAAAAADDDDDEEDEGDRIHAALPLETLSLSGIRAADRGLSWLWRRCANLRWLQLRACEGTGDGPSSPFFPLCLHGLLGLELRTCRTIADRVLRRAADHCQFLSSLLLYDGGSRDALRHFIDRRGAALRTLDLRLPLDLHNDHLFAIAADNQLGSGLAALRLQSCCLVTGDGLRSIARAPVGAAMEELALVNCDVVEREPGLLTFLGQSLPQLRRLDLSYNEMLMDKEVGSMLASCQNLVDIRIRGCRALTGASVLSILKYCARRLEVIDITRCPQIGIDVIEILILNACRLSHVIVEESKVSEPAKEWVSRKAIKID